DAAGIVVILGFACILGLSYGFGRIGTTLIPDKSKPTVTWGRKAMGQHRHSPATAVMVARLPKESSHDVAQDLAVALGARPASFLAPCPIGRPAGGRMPGR